ncbi:restriction endonuclease (plasmid) [Streptomyces sp. BI20]|uniref:restriction endonuclease n=1 Tax=Streptomyces sp. BI20 TaxID=3403460 RepID=UPI003C73E2EE
MDGTRAARAGAEPIAGWRDLVLGAGLTAAAAGGLGVLASTLWDVPVRSGGPIVAALLLACLAVVAGVRGRRRRGPARRPPAEPVPGPTPAEVVPRPHGADPDGFEHAVAALCARDGCALVEVSGGAGDLGADVLARTPDGRRLVVQCKRYAPDRPVGSQDLQRFGGTCFAVHGAEVAVVVTTSAFTEPALRYAAEVGILCLTGADLDAWAEGAAAPPWEPARP